MERRNRGCLPTTSTPFTQTQPNNRPWHWQLPHICPTTRPMGRSSSLVIAVSEHQPTTSPKSLNQTNKQTNQSSSKRTHIPRTNQEGGERRGEKTMKREGWQHGAVRVNRNKLLRIADGEAARAGAAEELLGGGAYAKAPSKPTNASRSRGKCRRPRCAGCHEHPVTKARDKAKGAHKLRACDVALNHRLVSWRVVDGAAGTGIPDYKGASASAVLAYLAGGNSWHEDDDDGRDLEETPLGKGGLSDLYDFIVGHHAEATPSTGQEADRIAVGETDAIEEQEQDTDGDEEDDMGFCMVGITIALEFSDGEEDWIVVEEIPST